MTAYIISRRRRGGAGGPGGLESVSRRRPRRDRDGGRYLARGGAIDVLEGDWSPHAMVIVAFPDRAAAMAWYASPEYAEALKVREGSSLHRRLICVEGAEDASVDKLL